MKTTKTTTEINWKEGDEAIWWADVRFGIFDSRGREMGVRLTVNAQKRTIWCSIQSCRNGETFGAAFPIEHDHPDVKSAMADAQVRCEVSLKKVERKAAKNGGVYQ